MKYRFVGFGFFLLFLGLVMINLSVNIMRQNPGPPSLSHIVWGLIGIGSSVSLFVGALILFITLLVLLVDKVHPTRVQS